VHRLKFYSKYRGDGVLVRKYKQIDQLERDQLAIHRSKGLSFSTIGKVLGRSGSALSREYKRNLNHDGNYLPSEAEYNAKRRKKWAAEIGSKCEPYEESIYSRLCEGWTPEQIAGRLSLEEKTLRSAMKQFTNLSTNCMLIGHHYYLESMCHAGIRRWVKRPQREK
jgi:IS30 family transposase